MVMVRLFWLYQSVCHTHDLQVYARSSTSHHSYDGYPNSQGNFTHFRLEQLTKLYSPSLQLSVTGYTPTQVNGNFELELPMHNTSTNLNSELFCLLFTSAVSTP